MGKLLLDIGILPLLWIPHKFLQLSFKYIPNTISPILFYWKGWTILNLERSFWMLSSIVLNERWLSIAKVVDFFSGINVIVKQNELVSMI